MNSNRCVCCGQEIPEGTQVCPNCIRKTLGVETYSPEAAKKTIRINKFFEIMDNWIVPIGICAFFILMIVDIAT